MQRTNRQLAAGLEALVAPRTLAALAEVVEQEAVELVTPAVLLRRPCVLCFPTPRSGKGQRPRMRTATTQTAAEVARAVDQLLLSRVSHRLPQQ